MAKKAASKPAKVAANSSGAKNSGANPMNNFEQRLDRLEKLGEQIRKTDIPLDQALAAFEEGIKLARTLEKDLEKIDSRIEILINSAEAGSGALADEAPEMELFEDEE